MGAETAEAIFLVVAKKSIILELSQRDRPCSLMSDYQWLKLLFLNLICNYICIHVRIIISNADDTDDADVHRFSKGWTESRDPRAIQATIRGRSASNRGFNESMAISEIWGLLESVSRVIIRVLLRHCFSLRKTAQLQFTKSRPAHKQKLRRCDRLTAVLPVARSGTPVAATARRWPRSRGR